MPNSAPIPVDEMDRLDAVHRYEVLDTPPERAFDDLTALAASMFETPVSLVSVVDFDRQFFKSRHGVAVDGSPREISFCAHAILQDDVMVVPDAAADPRFADNPFVTGPAGFRFYAGAPLRSPDGHAIGTLCVADVVPRHPTAEQVDQLRKLGGQAVAQLELRKSNKQLIAAERFARSTVDSLPAAIGILDSAGTIVDVNRGWALQRATGLVVGAVGHNYVSLCDGATDVESSQIVAAGVRDVLDGRRRSFTTEYPARVGDQWRWFSVRVNPFTGEGPVRLVVAHEDVTDRHTAVQQLHHDARHDALTGLPNRVHFADQVERCIGLSSRGDYRFAVLFLDLDRFKVINDSLGHAAGDQVLTTVAVRLKTIVRSSDTVAIDRESAVARMGGDEFTILLENISAPSDAARLAERILSAVARPIWFEGHELTTTASIGIVTGGTAASAYTAAKDVLRDADAAMYKAKSGGKDRYVIFDRAMHEEAVDRMRVEADLRRAIERSEFELHYQPILDMTTRAVTGFEALIRWRRDQRLTGPAEFIPVAEDTGLILPIGRWVLTEACRQLAAWRASDPAMGDLYVTVNVSRRQLGDPDLVPTLQRVLAETGLPAGAVVLEITESAITDDPGAARTSLDRLKGVGVRLALDDFGTGYSSLACLQQFPIDLLKIDRSFVQRGPDGRESIVVRGIIKLAHDLGLVVVAEGVESAEQAALLADCRCDLGQGFFFGRPIPAADLGRPQARAA